MKRLLGLLLVLLSCQVNELRQETVVEPTSFIDGDYKLVAENLYQDKLGNIYFRTIDRSAINGEREVYAVYRNELLFDTIIDGEETFFEKELKITIDIPSFKKVNIEDRITYYEDKFHKYFHYEVADGGVLHCYQ